MKSKLLIWAVLLLFLLSGCNFSQTTVESLVKPPVLSAEQQEIYKALVAYEKKDISLIYPKTGEYRSAYVIQNFDDEPSDEALVFYKEASPAATTMKINVLDQVDGKWRSCWVTPEIEAVEVERVSFVKKEESFYIVIGFLLSTNSVNTKEMKIYQYQNSRMNAVFSEQCSSYEVCDLDDDGVQDLITIVSKTASDSGLLRSERVNTARFYQYEFDSAYQTATFNLENEIEMDSSATSYSNIFKGYLEDEIPALYVEGVRGNNIATELLVVSGGKIKNINLENGENLVDKTYRPLGLYSMDIDGDGAYEIPKDISIVGSDSQVYLLNWYGWDEGRLIEKCTTFTDYSYGFSFSVPDRWVMDVAAKKDSVNQEVIFYLKQPDIPKDDTKQILKIKVFMRSNLNSNRLPDGYTELQRNGQFIYGYQIMPYMDEEYEMTEAEIRLAFRHI